MASPYLERQARSVLDALLDATMPQGCGRSAFFRVINAMQLSVMITDRSSGTKGGPRILHVNDALCTMMGYPRDALIGQTPGMFQGPRTDLATAHRFRHRLHNHGQASTRLINYRADGTELTVDLLATQMVLGTPIDDEVYVAYSHRAVSAHVAASAAAGADDAAIFNRRR